MKNIWKNALLVLSLIGLMVTVSSCGGDDGGSDPAPTSTTYATTSITYPDGETAPSVTVTMVLHSDKVTVSGVGGETLVPALEDKDYDYTAFNALWTEGSVSSSTNADNVTLVKTETSSTSRTKGTERNYTYTFKKQ
ncbi:hypothetical protein [Flammeovirga pacifica]|uniref:Uncharacterized protein n=1 Tax=Flammeovirga pacifica TaxID=915059 RepID=A0A1S1Z3J5_FLAPC|nr:hypothetical protein [Flammeovirga pacifica]OHX67802.1 hypothetical protein NH26_16385 [Flammeovirga pacifica]